MIHSVAGKKPLPPQVVDLLAAKSDGNPLYVEELTHMLLESGQLVERDENYELAVALPSLEIPATLRDSLVARLDRLSQGKTIIQVGATIGRRFDYALIRQITELADDELTAELERLTAAGFCSSTGPRRRPPIRFATL